MSQVSDVSIANQGFSAFRTELNNILGAINTSHIGSSAPASLAAGSLWVDTSAGVTAYALKFYDGSDSIQLGLINTTANTVKAYLFKFRNKTDRWCEWTHLYCPFNFNL